AGAGDADFLHVLAFEFPGFADRHARSSSGKIFAAVRDYGIMARCASLLTQTLPRADKTYNTTNARRRPKMALNPAGLTGPLGLGSGRRWVVFERQGYAHLFAPQCPWPDRPCDRAEHPARRIGAGGSPAERGRPRRGVRR